MDVTYRINSGWTYNIDKSQGFVIAPSGVSSEVDMKAITILDAIKAGCSTMEAIKGYVKEHGVTLSPDEFEQARIEELLELLFEAGIVSKCA